MQAEGTRHPLETLLTQEVQCSERLLECLEAERSALAQRDMDALEQTTQKKIEQTQLLERLETQREKIISELGYESGSHGLRQCFKNLPRCENLNRLWQQIMANIESCQTGNLTNGGILESSRQHVEHALCILRGQSGTPSLYDTNGSTSASLGQRELGKV